MRAHTHTHTQMPTLTTKDRRLFYPCRRIFGNLDGQAYTEKPSSSCSLESWTGPCKHYSQSLLANNFRALTL